MRNHGHSQIRASLPCAPPPNTNDHHTRQMERIRALRLSGSTRELLVISDVGLQEQRLGGKVKRAGDE